MCILLHIPVSCSHHWKGDARQSSKAEVDLDGFNEFLCLVDVETQQCGTHYAECNEESAAQPCKVLPQRVSIFIQYKCVKYRASRLYKNRDNLHWKAVHIILFYYVVCLRWCILSHTGSAPAAWRSRRWCRCLHQSIAAGWGRLCSSVTTKETHKQPGTYHRWSGTTTTSSYSWSYKYVVQHRFSTTSLSVGNPKTPWTPLQGNVLQLCYVPLRLVFVVPRGLEGLLVNPWSNYHSDCSPAGASNI